jgi:hypothetical protein
VRLSDETLPLFDLTRLEPGALIHEVSQHAAQPSAHTSEP